MAQVGDFKRKNGVLYRMSSTGKWFRTSNSPEARRQRALNARLDKPIAGIPGTNFVSPTTERQLAHEAGAATTVKYGAQDQALARQLAQAVQQQTDTQNWYQDYRNRLKGYTDAIAHYNQGFTDAMARLPGAVQGLGQQNQQFEQGQLAQSNAVTGGTPAPSVAQDASAANAVGQGVAANWAAFANATANANNNYAQNYANTVAPGQEANAIANKQGQVRQVQGQQTQLASEKGAFNQSYRDQRRADEMKNLLAEGALGVNVQNAATKAQQSSPSGKAAAAYSQAEAKKAAQFGYSLHDWRMLGPKGRAKVMAKPKASDVITSGPLAGHTKSWVASHPGQSQTIVDSYNKRGGKGKGGKGGSGGSAFLTAHEMNTATTKAVRAEKYARQLKNGEEIAATDPKTGKKIVFNALGTFKTRPQAADFLRQQYPTLDEALLSAVLDSAYNNPPRLSAYTVRKLIQFRYKPSVVASALGIPTNMQARRKGLKPKVTTPPTKPTPLVAGTGGIPGS